jgi:hypothetical protein
MSITKTPLAPRHFADGAGSYLGAFAGLKITETRLQKYLETGAVLYDPDTGEALLETLESEEWPSLPANAVETGAPPPGPNRLWDGTAWIETPPPIEEIRADARAEVDRQAEDARRRFITPGSGQALEYEQTRAEAEAADLAADPLDPAVFPMLEAERAALEAAGVTVTLRQVCQQVLAEFAAWQATGAEIKRVRRTAKLQIAAAPDRAAVDAILAGLAWPTP